MLFIGIDLTLIGGVLAVLFISGYRVFAFAQNFALDLLCAPLLFTGVALVEYWLLSRPLRHYEGPNAFSLRRMFMLMLVAAGFWWCVEFVVLGESSLVFIGGALALSAILLYKKPKYRLILRRYLYMKETLFIVPSALFLTIASILLFTSVRSSRESTMFQLLEVALFLFSIIVAVMISRRRKNVEDDSSETFERLETQEQT